MTARFICPEPKNIPVLPLPSLCANPDCQGVTIKTHSLPVLSSVCILPATPLESPSKSNVCQVDFNTQPITVGCPSCTLNIPLTLKPVPSSYTCPAHSIPKGASHWVVTKYAVHQPLRVYVPASGMSVGLPLVNVQVLLGFAKFQASMIVCISSVPLATSDIALPTVPTVSALIVKS